MSLERLGDYRILGTLGAGAMGVVYRARQEGLDRDIALKVIGQSPGSDAGQARFIREMRTAAKLDHPELVRVYDGGFIGETAYIAMELVEGAPLDAVLKESGAVPWPLAVSIGVRIARGLAYLHERKVIHRDLKPGNILMSRTGRVQITDFGLVRAEGVTLLTRTGQVMGTLKYLAPEVLVSSTYGPAQDVWALGCILYQMVAGRAPFASADTRELLGLILQSGYEPLDRAVPGLPPGVTAIVVSLLQPDPEARIAAGRDLEERLEAELVESSGATSDRLLESGVLDSSGSFDRWVGDRSSVRPRPGGAPGVRSGRSRPGARRSGPSRPGSGGTATSLTGTGISRTGISGVSRPAIAAGPGPVLRRFGAALLAGSLVVWGFHVWGLRGKGARARDAAALPIAGEAGRGDPAALASGPATTPAKTPDSTPGMTSTITSGVAPAPSRAPALPSHRANGGRLPSVSAQLVAHPEYRKMLEAGGDQAQIATRALANLCGADLGRDPIHWSNWAAIEDWLARPSGLRYPPIRSRRPGAALAGWQDLLTARGYEGVQHADVRDQLELVMASLADCDDPRLWLLVGWLLETDGRAPEARRIYELALARMGDLSLHGWPVTVWAGYARAVHASGGVPELERQWWAHVPEDGNLMVPMGGLRRAFPADDALVMRVLQSEPGKKHQLQRRALALLAGRIPLEVGPGRWSDVMEAWDKLQHDHPSERTGLCENILKGFLSRGYVDRAAEVPLEPAQKAGWASMVAYLEGKAPPPEKLIAGPAMAFKTSDLDRMQASWLSMHGRPEAAEAAILALHPEPEWGVAPATLAALLLASGRGTERLGALVRDGLSGTVADDEVGMEAAGAFAAPDRRARFASILAGVTDPHKAHAWKCLWEAHFRSPSSPEPVVAIPGAPRPSPGLVCEVHSRPRWLAVMAARGVPATKAVWPVEDRPIVPDYALYWDHMQNDELALAAQQAQLLFERFPRETFWAEVLIASARLRGDAAEAALWTRRLAAACRYHCVSGWLLESLPR